MNSELKGGRREIVNMPNYCIYRGQSAAAVLKSSDSVLTNCLSSLTDMARLADAAKTEESEQKMKLHRHPFYLPSPEVLHS